MLILKEARTNPTNRFDMTTQHEAYFHFDKEFKGWESILELVTFVQDNRGKNMLISIDCNGGHVTISQFLTRVLNENRDKITLLLNMEAYSAAFKLFYMFKGHRMLSKGSVGMWHEAGSYIRVSTGGKINKDSDRNFYESQKQPDIDDEEFAKSFMTPSEFKKYRKGENVYFSFERMKQIFPDAVIVDP